MTKHLSDRGVSMFVIGDVSQGERQHAQECIACRARIASLTELLGNFRNAVRNWSETATARDRAAQLNWTVIRASGHLERLLPPSSLSMPWYCSLWINLRETLRPERPPLDITAKPVLVRDIWGQFGPQKKSWILSAGLQSAAVLLLFAFASANVAQRQVLRLVQLADPILAPHAPKPAPVRDTSAGGGGGGDRSPIPASKGRLPKASLRQFTPPMVAVKNPEPRLTMEPSIVAPPEVPLPNVNMAQYGDPLGKLGQASNGPGSSGGIGSGHGGGVGPGKGGGFGPGDGEVLGAVCFAWAAA